MAGIGDLFGQGKIGSEFLLWNVGSELTGALLGPLIQSIANDSWGTAIALSSGTLYVPLSPPDLARMVVRNIRTISDSSEYAALSGVRPTDFQDMVDAYGNPIGPDALARALFRGLIQAQGTGADSTSFEQGIAEGDTKNKWGPIVQSLALEWPSPDEVVNGIVRNQTTTIPLSQLYQMAGGDPQWLQLREDIRGNPPSPGELVEFVRRGLIQLHGTGSQALTFQQGIYEGDTKDKWEPLYEALVDYIPPPRTVTTLLSHDVITSAQATQLFQENGLSPALAGIYAASATSEKLATNKALTQGVVEKLYYDRLITADQASTFLTDLGFATEEITYLLEAQDFSRDAAAYTSAVSRVGSLYVGHKLSRAGAVDSLQKLDVPTDAVAQLLQTWDASRASNVRTLTPSEIGLAYAYGVKDGAWCISKLVELGYDQHDAWVLLGVENKGPAADVPEPAEGVAAGMEPSVTE